MLEEKRGKTAAAFGEWWEGKESHVLPSLCKEHVLGFMWPEK